MLPVQPAAAIARNLGKQLTSAHLDDGAAFAASSASMGRIETGLSRPRRFLRAAIDFNGKDVWGCGRFKKNEDRYAPSHSGAVPSSFTRMSAECGGQALEQTRFLSECPDDDIAPMESLSETKWDVVIAGTGLAQSLLALSVLFTSLNNDNLF